MLVWHNIVFVVGIERLMLWRDIDLLCGHLDACKVLEQVGVVGGMEVEVGEGGVARLMMVSACSRQIEGYRTMIYVIVQ